MCLLNDFQFLVGAGRYRMLRGHAYLLVCVPYASGELDAGKQTCIWHQSMINLVESAFLSDFTSILARRVRKKPCHIAESYLHHYFADHTTLVSTLARRSRIFATCGFSTFCTPLVLRSSIESRPIAIVDWNPFGDNVLGDPRRWPETFHVLAYARFQNRGTCSRGPTSVSTAAS